MSLIWLFQCDNQDCDFAATFGYWLEWPGIECALCLHCLGEIYLSEPSPKEQGSRNDALVLRIMRRLPSPSGPDLGRTPRERRLKRKALGMPPKGRMEAPPMPVFEPSGEYLMYDREGKPLPGSPSGHCPDCGTAGSIVRGLEEGAECPKCAAGRLILVFGPA